MVRVTGVNYSLSSYYRLKESWEGVWNLQWPKWRKRLCLPASRDLNRNPKINKKNTQMPARPEATATVDHARPAEKTKWLGVKMELKQHEHFAAVMVKTMKIGFFPTEENQRPRACSLDQGCTWTREVGASCTLWPATRLKRWGCTPFCCAPGATSAPSAGSPCWTSCLPCCLRVLLFRSCSRLLAVIILSSTWKDILDQEINLWQTGQIASNVKAQNAHDDVVFNGLAPA